jgi:AcrR family transcriptional regulator
VYKHFGTRAALFTELIRDFGEDLFGRISSAVTEHPRSIGAAVRAASEAYLDFLAERGRGVRDLFSSAAGDPAVEEARRASRRDHLDLWVRRLDQVSDRPVPEKRAIASVFVASMEILGNRVQSGALARKAAIELHAEIVLSFLAREVGGSR